MVRLLEHQRQDVSLPLDDRWEEISGWLDLPAGRLRKELGVPDALALDLEAAVGRRNRVAHSGWMLYSVAENRPDSADLWVPWLHGEAVMLMQVRRGLAHLTTWLREARAEVSRSAPPTRSSTPSRSASRGSPPAAGRSPTSGSCTRRRLHPVGKRPAQPPRHRLGVPVLGRSRRRLKHGEPTATRCSDCRPVRHRCVHGRVALLLCAICNSDARAIGCYRFCLDAIAQAPARRPFDHLRHAGDERCTPTKHESLCPGGEPDALARGRR
jgi:hypothetical protein